MTENLGQNDGNLGPMARKKEKEGAERIPKELANQISWVS